MRSRITAIANLVPQADCAADIGCDHGQLGGLLLRRGQASRVIATDISAPSLAKARAALEGVSGVDFRCGDGLAVLRPAEADVICIAGMGGLQMMRMLKERPDIARRVRALVLSPHRNAPELRSFLRRSEYRIAKEIVLLDRGRYYTAMCVVPGHDTEDDPLWNLVLRGDPRDTVYAGYLEHLLRKMQKRIQILAQAAPDDPDLPALQLSAARIRELRDEHTTAREHH